MEAGLSALRAGLEAGDRISLARVLSLIESVRAEDVARRFALLDSLPAPTEPTYRVGFTGTPGAGKSTLIDTLGAYVLEQYPETQLAVLTVDPSSWRSGGSLLGDQTRMQHLSGHPRAFLRSFASGGHLGGLHPRIYEAVTACEAAGFSWIFLETVGTGQSEIELRYACDFLLYVALPYGGDEVQGLKRGLMEALDGAALNKVDTTPPAEVNRAQFQLEAALHFLRGMEERVPFVVAVSALTGLGISELWAKIHEAYLPDRIAQQRTQQRSYWLEKYWQEALQTWLACSPYGQLYADLRKQATEKSLWQLAREVYRAFGLME